MYCCTCMLYKRLDVCVVSRAVSVVPNHVRPCSVFCAYLAHAGMYACGELGRRCVSKKVTIILGQERSHCYSSRQMKGNLWSSAGHFTASFHGGVKLLKARIDSSLCVSPIRVTSKIMDRSRQNSSRFWSFYHIVFPLLRADLTHTVRLSYRKMFTQQPKKNGEMTSSLY